MTKLLLAFLFTIPLIDCQRTNNTRQLESTRLVLENLRKEFESIRKAIGGVIGSRSEEVTQSSTSNTWPNNGEYFETFQIPLLVLLILILGPPNSGPSTDVGEWFETITSLARQLPFVEQIYARVAQQVRAFNRELGLSRILGGQGSRVAENLQRVRGNLRIWLNRARSLVIRGSEKLQHHRIAKQLAGRQRYDQNADNYLCALHWSSIFSSEISKQEDIIIDTELNTIGRLISAVVDATSTVRSSIGDALNEIAAATARIVPEGIIDRRKRQTAPAGIFSVETLRTINDRIAVALDVATRFAANYLVSVTNQRALTSNTSDGSTGRSFTDTAGRIRQQIHELALRIAARGW